MCELGTHYNALEKEVQELRHSLETEKTKSTRLEQEKRSLGGNRILTEYFWA